MLYKISIITVVFNLLKTQREKQFRHCVESIHQENDGQIEHLIVDGGSQDGTLQILEEYKSKGWINYISEPDNGIYDAMNKGVRLAQGEYVWFINSDDYVIEGAVATILEQADFGKVDMFVCGVCNLGVGDKQISVSVPKLIDQGIVYEKELHRR